MPSQNIKYLVWLSSLEQHPVQQKDTSSIFSQSRCVVQSPIRVWAGGNYQCSTLSVSLSFPLPLNPIKACPCGRNKIKIFKHFLLQYFFLKKIFLEPIYVLNILSCLLCTYWMTFKFPNPCLHLYNLSLVLLIVKCCLWALPLEDVI